MDTTRKTLIEMRDVEVVYSHVILALRGFSLNVPQGRIIALLGANGAGKSTALKAISKLLTTERGQITRGQTLYNSKNMRKMDTPELVKNGVIHVMEARHYFPDLSV